MNNCRIPCQLNSCDFFSPRFCGGSLPDTATTIMNNQNICSGWYISCFSFSSKKLIGKALTSSQLVILYCLGFAALLCHFQNRMTLQMQIFEECSSSAKLVEPANSLFECWPPLFQLGESILIPRQRNLNDLDFVLRIGNGTVNAVLPTLVLFVRTYPCQTRHVKVN